jgi:2-dehydro-3-deoxyphosphogluconate aldolase/(4S)-4-hydroxy-2-oxoglutarate aldolase
MPHEQEVFEKIAEFGVVPVIAIDSAEQALPLADALIAGGLPLAEITFRTEAAAETIRQIAKNRPQMLVGAGTVLTPATVAAAREAGAAFAVAPGLNARVIGSARALNLPFVPGTANPSDVEIGLELGCKLLKFFPAEALGGAKLLSAIYAPYKHTGVKFMPTGGVTADNLESYLRLPAVAAVGGTWLAKPADIAAGNWDAIAERCRAACKIVASLKKQ